MEKDTELSGLGGFHVFHGKNRKFTRATMEREEKGSKTKRLSSWVWNHYKISPEDKTLAKCNRCDFSSNHMKGTNPMSNHLKMHQIFKPIDQEGDSSPTKRERKTCKDQQNLEVKMCVFFFIFIAFFVEQFLILRAHFIAECHLPVNIVEKKSFNDLFAIANPLFVVPSRNSVTDTILSEGQSVKVQVSFILFLSFFHSFTHSSDSKFDKRGPVPCLLQIADLWKSKARVYYVGVTIQFVDANWKLWNVPVGFEQIIGTHSNEAVGNLITQILKPFLGTFFLLTFSFSF